MWSYGRQPDDPADPDERDSDDNRSFTHRMARGEAPAAVQQRPTAERTEGLTAALSAQQFKVNQLPCGLTEFMFNFEQPDLLERGARCAQTTVEAVPMSVIMLWVSEDSPCGDRPARCPQAECLFEQPVGIPERRSCFHSDALLFFYQAGVAAFVHQNSAARVLRVG